MCLSISSKPTQAKQQTDHFVVPVFCDQCQRESERVSLASFSSGNESLLLVYCWWTSISLAAWDVDFQCLFALHRHPKAKNFPLHWRLKNNLMTSKNYILFQFVASFICHAVNKASNECNHALRLVMLMHGCVTFKCACIERDVLKG